MLYREIRNFSLFIIIHSFIHSFIHSLELHINSYRLLFKLSSVYKRDYISSYPKEILSLTFTDFHFHLAQFTFNINLVVILFGFLCFTLFGSGTLITHTGDSLDFRSFRSPVRAYFSDNVYTHQVVMYRRCTGILEANSTEKLRYKIE